MNKHTFEILNNVDVSLLIQSDLTGVLRKLSPPSNIILMWLLNV